MKSKAIIPLALGLGVGLFAVKFLVDAVKRAQGASAEQAVIQVVRATQDLGSFTEILAEQVELVETAEDGLIAAHERVSKLEDVIGRVTAKAIPQNSPILASYLAPVGTPTGTKGKIPPGFRAVSVKIDEVSAVAYQLGPGDWVDVTVVMDVTSRRGGQMRKDTIAEVILQKIQVLAIGRSDTVAPDGTKSGKAAKSATLLVAESDVPKLHLAGTRGKITLSMRGIDDDTDAQTKVTVGSQVFEALKNLDPEEDPNVIATTPQPQKPQPRHAVHIYRNASDKSSESSETILFENGKSRRVITREETIEAPEDAEEKMSDFDNQEVE